MQIGEVIRTNRKRLGLTQEQVADRLGVTATAVNKWERGASMPDIALLGPIARLLGVSLEELLSFREELTDEEIGALVRQADEKFSKGPYEAVYEWVRRTLAQWPNCEKLTLHLARMLDSWARMLELGEDRERDRFIEDCYDRLLTSRDEGIRRDAADALHSLYMWREQYDKAEEYLAYFSKYDPMRKWHQGHVFEKTGRGDEALKTYEELLLSGCNMLTLTFQSMQVMALRAKDLPRARMLAEKQCALAELMEMGAYAAASPMLEVVMGEKDADGMVALAQKLLDSADTLGGFTASELYAHMTFKPVERDFGQAVRNGLLEGFRTDEAYAFVRDDPRWQAMLAKYE